MSRGSAGTEPGVGRGLSLESGTDELQRAEVGSGWGPGTVVAAVPAGEAAAVGTKRGVPGTGPPPPPFPVGGVAGLNPCRGCVGGGQRQLRGRGRRCPRALCKRRGRGAERGLRGLRASCVNVQRGRHMPTSELSRSASRGCLAVWNRKCQRR